MKKRYLTAIVFAAFIVLMGAFSGCSCSDGGSGESKGESYSEESPESVSEEDTETEPETGTSETESAEPSEDEGLPIVTIPAVTESEEPAAESTLPVTESQEEPSESTVPVPTETRSTDIELPIIPFDR